MREGGVGGILVRPPARPAFDRNPDSAAASLRPTRATRGGGASAAGPTPEGATHTLGAAEAVGSPCGERSRIQAQPAERSAALLLHILHCHRPPPSLQALSSTRTHGDAARS